MKKNIIAALMFFAVQCVTGQVDSKLFTYTKEVTYDKQNQLNFVTFKESPQVNEAAVPEFINTMIFANSDNKVAVLKTEKDEYGFTHTKYSILQNGVALSNKLIIAHCKNGQLSSLNGDLYPFSTPANKFSLTEKSALTFALQKIHAKKYKWENKVEEDHMREVFNKPDFTYYPKGEKVIYEKDGKFLNAYKFDIYAEEPLYHANVFVDAGSGKILSEQNLICNIDVPGTGSTKYSAIVTLTCDVTGGIYTLKEAGRGLGIETYNLNHTATYAANNFTNATATWTNWGSASTSSNQASTDAHWGAENTYDFYSVKFNRNSIDNAGYKLRSYIHYNTNYNNAFWDGTKMTYGDGNGTTFTIFTAQDVCGHEITHGLVSNTAALGLGNGTDECDALNEGFADIFGTSIERFAKPLTWNWIMGKDITTNGAGLRNMANPKSLGQPDTYLGMNWDAAGEPHNNNGPITHWFYLLVSGGSGTNDLGNPYTVAGLGNVDAEKIAFRALTVYFVPSTNYAFARVAAIQAAKDLFGDCSNQVEQTARAFYAVGVGSNYSTNVVGPNFQSQVTNFCSLPAVVNFTNTTSNGQTYTWSFGDGASATTTNAVHTYTSNGSFTVKLKATGCGSATDSISMPSLVIINVPPAPVATGGLSCGTGAATLNASGTGFMSWFTSPFSSFPLGTGSSFITPILTSNTTFYVSNTISNNPVVGGKTSFTGGASLNGNTQYLTFDVLQNSTLNSVQVYAYGTGNRIVELRNSTGVINSTTVGLTAGVNTVVLNYALAPGTAYQLGLNNTSASNLYRSTTGVAFPYNIGGCVSITGSSSGYYYFYYNWTVTKADCISPAVAVTASIVPAPVVSVSAPVSLLCLGDVAVNLTGTPPGGTLSGLNVSGNMFNPILAGSSNVLYNYSDSNGCSDTSSISMLVSICTGINSLQASNAGISIFPNPATDQLTIKNEFGDVTVSVSDASGRIVFNKQIQAGEENVNLNGLSKGLYLVNVKDQTSQTIKTIKLVKE